MRIKTGIEICNEIRVCLNCYDKVLIHLKKNKSNLCHICLQSTPHWNFDNLLWIGDEQVVWCGRTSCREEIANLDRLSEALRHGATAGEELKP